MIERDQLIRSMRDPGSRELVLAEVGRMLGDGVLDIEQLLRTSGYLPYAEAASKHGIKTDAIYNLVHHHKVPGSMGWVHEAKLIKNLKRLWPASRTTLGQDDIGIAEAAEACKVSKDVMKNWKYRHGLLGDPGLLDRSDLIEFLSEGDRAKVYRAAVALLSKTKKS